MAYRKTLFLSLSAWYATFAAAHLYHGWEIFQDPAITLALPGQFLASYKGNYYGLTALMLTLSYQHYRWSASSSPQTKSDIRVVTGLATALVSGIGAYYSQHGEPGLWPVMVFAAGFQALGWIAA
ncbi:hypothetical protein PG989_015265 [Apiospora arundinis]